MANGAEGLQALASHEAVIKLLGTVTVRNMRAEGGSALAVQGVGGEIRVNAQLGGTSVLVDSCGATAGTYGAAVVKAGGKLKVTQGKVRFVKCFSEGAGGALTVEGTDSLVDLIGGPVTFQECSATTNGGAVAVLDGGHLQALSATAATATSFVKGSGAMLHAVVC